jgi:hypothetical protein
LNKKQIILGIIFVIAVVAAYYPFSFAAHQYGNLDSDTKHLVTTILVAGCGGSLFALRNTKRVTPKILEVIEAWELLILTIIPSLEIVSFLMKNPVNLAWSMIPFIIATVLWYAIVLIRHKPLKTPEEERRFTISMTYFFAAFIVMGSAATAILLFLLSLSKS